MLGQGRPFVVELHNPKWAISGITDIHKFYDAVKSDDIYVKDLKIVSTTHFDEILRNEKTKSKLYTAVVWSEKRITPQELTDKIDSFKEQTIQQKTPLWVLHRRSLMTWSKLIHRLKAEYINPHFFKLHLLASAGTYIKEFVHSDLGRTVPNIGSLLESRCDILQLDVTNLFTPEELPSDDSIFDIKVID